MLRTHNCAELRKENLASKVQLCGWVSTRRDHGDIIFMDIRDKYGITQIVFDPEKNKEAHEKAHELRTEFCVRIFGQVTMRPEGTINGKIPTGEIEVEVEEVEIFSESLTPPFEIKDSENVSEDVRLKYRYLDLRRPDMQKKLQIKHDAYKFVYDFLDSEKFVSVETPILTKSTPEGARDYLVPCRVQDGSFYALPQSPQIFKQLLMVAGTDKYFQLARCFRDEDLRADRQPEFTQLDMEMSFVDQEDIFDVCERLFQGLFKKIMGRDIAIPFPRIDYDEAMSRYGSDKPDTRFDIFLHDLTEDVRDSGFKVFDSVVSSGGTVAAIVAPGYKDLSRKEIDILTTFVGEYGARGLAYFKVEEDGLSSPITKFFSEEKLRVFQEKTGAKLGDMIFMVADSKDIVLESLGALRLKIGKEKGLRDPKVFNFTWVVNFPLFRFNKDEQRWVSEHHPFTSYNAEDKEHLENNELEKVRSQSYDLVLNGSEIGSGSIRIHQRAIQQKIFNCLGLSEEECEAKFGFLLNAFRYGPPPHGGAAFGMDRLITLFTGDPSIREVIPFPKTQKGVCPLTEAPSRVDEKQLTELGIRLRHNKKDEE